MYSNRLIEGLENEDTTSSSNVDSTSESIQTNKNENKEKYKPYNLQDPNNSLILAQQNAGNIEVLKGRIDNLDNVKQRVDDMQQSMNLMQTQIDGLVQQQADMATELTGDGEPAVIGGLDEDEEEDENEEI